MYVKMPFGLMNVGATFQRAMDIAFSEELGYFIIIYLDDVTVFSNTDEEHLEHLSKFFEKCRKFGISLNPKKTLFSLQEGKLLGHIIYEKGTVEEVNPLCGQRRSLLAQQGSSNKQTML